MTQPPAMPFNHLSVERFYNTNWNYAIKYEIIQYKWKTMQTNTE